MTKVHFGRIITASSAVVLAMVFNYVTRLNIEHFKKLLATEGDPQKRALLTSLLNEEERKICSTPSDQAPQHKKI